MDGKKMTIWSAKPPVPSSSAVEGAAGQVIQLDNGQPAVRCGDGKVVMLTEVQIDSFCYSGSEWIAQQTMPLVLTGQIQVQAS
jgi:methionyl-tRNA formyltransferase